MHFWFIFVSLQLEPLSLKPSIESLSSPNRLPQPFNCNSSVWNLQFQSFTSSPKPSVTKLQLPLACPFNLNSSVTSFQLEAFSCNTSVPSLQSQFFVCKPSVTTCLLQPIVDNRTKPILQSQAVGSLQSQQFNSKPSYWRLWLQPFSCNLSIATLQWQPFSRML